MNLQHPLTVALENTCPRLPAPQAAWVWGTWLHHHGSDVSCVFVLCVVVSLMVCTKVPESNLKEQILPYYKVSRHCLVPHIGLHHTFYDRRNHSAGTISSITVAVIKIIVIPLQAIFNCQNSFNPMLFSHRLRRYKVR
jgi:hypothetical protein